MRYSGRVTRQQLSAGSKSEHLGVVLLTREGPLKLRRAGGNPFVDNELEKLIGHEIDCEGRLQHGQLVVTDWNVLERGR